MIMMKSLFQLSLLVLLSLVIVAASGDFPDRAEEKEEDFPSNLRAATAEGDHDEPSFLDTVSSFFVDYFRATNGEGEDESYPDIEEEDFVIIYHDETGMEEVYNYGYDDLDEDGVLVYVYEKEDGSGGFVHVYEDENEGEDKDEEEEYDDEGRPVFVRRGRSLQPKGGRGRGGGGRGYKGGRGGGGYGYKGGRGGGGYGYKGGRGGGGGYKGGKYSF